MYTFYTLVAIGIFITLWVIMTDGEDRLPKFIVGIFMTLLLSVIVTLLISLGGSISLDNDKHWGWNEGTTSNLYSIRDKNGVSGSISGNIFLIHGRISGATYYNYFVKEPDGALIPNDLTIESNETVRIYEDISTPRIETFEYVFQDRGQWQLKWFWMPRGSLRVKYRQYNIYVPSGTVRTEFSL